MIALFLQNLDGGGAERAILKLAYEVAELGYAVDLVVGDANSDYRAEVPREVNLIDFSTRSPFAVFFGLAAYLRRRKPAVIMSALDVPNIMLVPAARLAGFRGRTVISQRAVLDASLRELGPTRRTLTRWLIRTCFPRADALISNSHAAATDLKGRLGIPERKVFTIPNAVDIHRIMQLAQESSHDRLLSDGDASLIVSVGSLTVRKDMETLIQAFALVKDRRPARLVIVGKGPERARLETLTNMLGVERHVYFAGFETNPYKWIASASVFVSSSVEEGFPNVIAESLALGCPVVATDCPGDSAELLGRGKWGRLVPVGDPERMAEAILAALDDRNPPDGRIRAADFAPSKIASAYVDVLLQKEADHAAGALHQSG